MKIILTLFVDDLELAAHIGEQLGDASWVRVRSGVIDVDITSGSMERLAAMIEARPVDINYGTVEFNARERRAALAYLLGARPPFPVLSDRDHAAVREQVDGNGAYNSDIQLTDLKPPRPRRGFRFRDNILHGCPRSFGEELGADAAPILRNFVNRGRVVGEIVALTSEHVLPQFEQDASVVRLWGSVQPLGTLAYQEEHLSELPLLSLTAERWQFDETASLIASRDFRERWAQSGLKGFSFKPVLVVGSTLHDEYVAAFARFFDLIEVGNVS